MSIRLEEVLRIAELSHLELKTDELERLRHQFEDILQYMSLLEEVSTEGVSPLYHPLQEEADENRWRLDETKASLSAEEAVAEAPQSHQGQFQVPRFID